MSGKMETRRLTGASLEAAKVMDTKLRALEAERVALEEATQRDVAALRERQEAVWEQFREVAEIGLGEGWQADMTYLPEHGEAFLFRDPKRAKVMN